MPQQSSVPFPNKVIGAAVWKENNTPTHLTFCKAFDTTLQKLMLHDPSFIMCKHGLYICMNLSLCWHDFPSMYETHKKGNGPKTKSLQLSFCTALTIITFWGKCHWASEHWSCQRFMSCLPDVANETHTSVLILIPPQPRHRREASLIVTDPDAAPTPPRGLRCRRRSVTVDPPNERPCEPRRACVALSQSIAAKTPLLMRTSGTRGQCHLL